MSEYEKSDQIQLLLLPVLNRFFHWFVVGLMIPVTGLLKLSKGVALEQIGFVMALYSVVVVVLELPTGILSDLWGRKRIYLLSIGFGGAAYLTVLLGYGFPAITAGFVLYGVSRALSSGSIESLFIDRFIQARGKANLHRLISALSVSETLGIALGALLGGLIPMVWVARFPTMNKYSGNILLQLGILAVLFISTAGLVRDIRGREEKRTKVSDFLRESAGFLRRNRVVPILLFAATVWGLSFTAVETYWQPQVRQILGTDERTWIFGLLSSGYFLAAVLGNLMLTALLSRAKNLSHFRLLSLLRVVTSILMVALALQDTIGGFSIVYMVMFFCHGLGNPVEQTIFNTEVPGDKRASLLSLQSLFLQLGGAAGACGYSIMLRYGSIQSVWFTAAGFFCLSAVPIVYLSRYEKRILEQGDEMSTPL